ncbi:MAG: ParB/RepB/Spo0J family partition protein [Phycisphaerales bacterium]
MAKDKASAPRRLGRGLSSLIDVPAVPVAVPASAPADQPATAISPVAEQSTPSPTGVRFLDTGSISPSPFQPRRAMSERTLDELASSLRRSGLMQPIIVRERAVGEFELVAGERRWRAAQRAGLAAIPALVKKLSDEDAAEWALVENIQREDLNAMDKAWAFRSLGERFGLSHAEIAERVGLERSSVVNFIRLTDLEQEIAGLIAAGRLSGGHGKALLQAPAGAGRVVLAKRAAEENWSVRRTESESVAAAGKAADGASAAVGGPRGAKAAERAAHTALLEDLERQLGEHLGTKVVISTKAGGKKGKIEIAFYDLDQFDGVMQRMGFKMR